MQSELIAFEVILFDSNDYSKHALPLKASQNNRSGLIKPVLFT